MVRMWKNAVNPSWGRRLLGIEGLRAFAAVAVMVTHVYGKLGPGAVHGEAERILGFAGNGLTLFFALSGFLLFRPFATAIIDGTPRPGIAIYALNRALRIFPGYIVILVLVSFVLGLSNTQAPTWGDTDYARTDASIGYLWNPAGFFASLFMIQTMFPATNRLGIGVAWSLSVELVFYILLPLLAILASWVLSRSGRRMFAALVPPAVLLALGGAGKAWSWFTLREAPENLRFAMQWGDNWYAVVNRSILVHGDLFAYGMIAAIVVVLAQGGAINARAIQRIRLACIPAALVCGLVGFFGYGRMLNDSLIGLACGALILLVVLPNRRNEHSLIARALEFAPIRYTGMVSYSFYLWHVPVILLLARYGWVLPETPLGLIGNMFVVFAITLAVSSVTYHFVEEPALRLKRRTGSRMADDGRALPDIDPAAAPR